MMALGDAVAFETRMVKYKYRYILLVKARNMLPDNPIIRRKKLQKQINSFNNSY